MFNLFSKKQIPSADHQYKNLLISLPSNWKYELEEGGQEACFDPESQSTLRLNIIKVVPPKGMAAEENIKSLTAGQPYIITSKGYILTRPCYNESVESGHNITLVTWKLINNTGDEKIMAVATYAVLSKQKDSPQEKEMLNLIEDSLQNAELLNN